MTATLTPVATITTRTYPGLNGDDESLTVVVTWTGAPLDRTDGLAWSVGPDSPRSRKLAARLVAAVNAGAVFGPAEIRTDVNGRTYVQASARILGRRMNADLKRLGF